MKPRIRLATIAGLLVAATVGVVAYAAIPDSSGVVHGCVRSGSGQLRVIDSATQGCSNNEAPLAWSQTGPAGPAGPQGEQGPPGTSEAHKAFVRDGFISGTSAANATEVVSLEDLPPGAYVAMASLEVKQFDTSVPKQNVSCQLLLGGAEHTGSTAVGQDVGIFHMMSFNQAFSSPAPIRARLGCWHGNAADPDPGFFSAVLVVIRVDQVGG